MSSDNIENYSLAVTGSDRGILEISIGGRLNFDTIDKLWDKTTELIEELEPNKIIIDTKDIEYCDTLGVTYFIKLNKYSTDYGYEYEIINFSRDYKKLLELFSSYDPHQEVAEDESKLNFIELTGKEVISHIDQCYQVISFIGEVFVGFIKYFSILNKIRWNDILVTAEKLGVNAFFIIALINFLVGLVIAFQSAIPLSEYGGTIFVADLLVLSVFKELGPLMTAIVVNGRSSSAFAAEIGTMKVNEEIDALSTMGVDKIRFLVMPKFIGTLLMLPVLSLFGILFALLGGLVVFITLGFPPITYLNQLVGAADYVDLSAGLFKTLFFAIIIAGVGCYEGLRTKSGASAVGDSTTKAVVDGLILIVLIDGIFGVVYYFLGI